MTKGRGGGRTPERLVELLNKAVKEISQSAVARETGITQSAVHRYMKGIGEPSQATLEKLADYFGVTPEWLRGADAAVKVNEMGAVIHSFYDQNGNEIRFRLGAVSRIFFAAVSTAMSASGESEQDQLERWSGFAQTVRDEINSELQHHKKKPDSE